MQRKKQVIIVLCWLILCKLLIRKRRRIKYIRRWHVRPINQLRSRYGDYETLFQDLKNNESLFFRYTRMTLPLFNKLVQSTEPYLRKYNYRALPAEQRLLIVLR